MGIKQVHYSINQSILAHESPPGLLLVAPMMTMVVCRIFPMIVGLNVIELQNECDKLLLLLYPIIHKKLVSSAIPLRCDNDKMIGISITIEFGITWYYNITINIIGYLSIFVTIDMSVSRVQFNCNTMDWKMLFGVHVCSSIWHKGFGFFNAHVINIFYH